MSSHQVLLLVVCALMTPKGAFISALPRLNTRQLTPAHFTGRAVNDNGCKNYMESCVPWETNCCNNMECINLARGYCLFPLEKCMCQKVTVDFY